MQSVIGNFTGNSLTDNRISSLIPILSTGIGLSLKNTTHCYRIFADVLLIIIIWWAVCMYLFSSDILHTWHI